MYKTDSQFLTVIVYSYYKILAIFPVLYNISLGIELAIASVSMYFCTLMLICLIGYIVRCWTAEATKM